MLLSGSGNMMKTEELLEKDLCLDDFDGIDDTRGWTSFDVLVHVSLVARDRYLKQQQAIVDQYATDNADDKRQSSMMARETKSNPPRGCILGMTKKRTRGAFEGQSTAPTKEEPSRHLTIKKPRKAAVLVWNVMPSIDFRIGPDRDLPQDVRNSIEGSGGTDILLVCEKYLTASDVKKEESRLLMPESVIKSSSFLNDQERELLKTRVGNTNKMREIPVKLLEPTLTSCDLGLRRWEMRKNGGKSSTVSYVLARGWNGVVARNDLKKGDLVQVWSFRVGLELGLALIAMHN
ncbi:putative B3 domain-containing protein At3g49610 [Punica granatum]|uniref:B3 domain-containing protein At3g49610 n=1 Tax=Punica granatum TaxID=22663 RepID=A0A6P8BUE1_PUNGR|nr:putative B3 domain-containing protein At3g49610 [Punica granatum]